MRDTIEALIVTGVSCLQFSGNQPNIIRKCVGSDITLPWTFHQDSQDTIVSMEWFFHGRSQEMIAMLSHDVFVPLPAFSDRVQHGSDGTLTIRHLTTEDSGNYTIEINVQSSSGSGFTVSDTIYVEVTGQSYSSLQLLRSCVNKLYCAQKETHIFMSLILCNI